MVKPGQRKYQVKSRLNWLRELLIFIVSLILWGYCAGVLIVLVSTFLNINLHIFQTIRTILNVESSEITTAFIGLGGIIVLITIYLICAFFITRRMRRQS